MIDGPWSFGDPWISATFVIVIALGALQGAYFTRTDRRLAAMAEKELAAGATTLSDDYQRQAQREGIDRRARRAADRRSPSS